jgi:hypothetical protein
MSSDDADSSTCLKVLQPSKYFEKRSSIGESPLEGGRSAPSQRRSKDRIVQFSRTDELQEIPHINDLSEEEVSGVWMSRAELQAIRRQCATIVRFVDADSATKHGVCLRGLEQNTPSYVAVQVGIRQQLYDAVYAIQQFQVSTGMMVTDLLSDACRKFSQESVIQAQIVGLNDATYVQSAPVITSSTG